MWFAHFKKHALQALCFLKGAKAGPSKLLPASRKTINIYTYSVDGKKGCEYIGDSQVNYSEYSLFQYDNDRLARIEKYGYTNELGSYVVNEHDNS